MVSVCSRRVRSSCSPDERPHTAACRDPGERPVRSWSSSQVRGPQEPVSSAVAVNTLFTADRHPQRRRAAVRNEGGEPETPIADIPIPARITSRPARAERTIFLPLHESEHTEES